MKQINAISKRDFDDNFSNKDFIYYDYGCFISILDGDNTEQKFDLSLDNVLQVHMWDIEKNILTSDGKTYLKPSDEELQRIVDFVNKNKDKVAFMVHCSAGISRSGAVVTYISEKFHDEVDLQKFREDNKLIQPNLYILNRLRELGGLK